MVLGDLKSPRLICLKGVLFLAAGGIAAAALILDRPTVRTALLLIACVWSFARAYYFAFYVIEHYVDPTYRFAGLWSAVRYLAFRRGRRVSAVTPPRDDTSSSASRRAAPDLPAHTR